MGTKERFIWVHKMLNREAKLIKSEMQKYLGFGSNFSITDELQITRSKNIQKKRWENKVRLEAYK